MPKEFLNKLTKLVEANLENEHFGIEELAREMGMSHSNIHRKLKEISNQNISQFIREIRLKKAKELLLNEELTAAEIAYRVGFGSPTYFNKCFHSYFGYSPGEFRNREPEIEPEEPTVEAETLPKKPKRSKIFWILIVCSLFLIPLSFFLINRFSGSKAADAKQKSIALLPFKYLGGESEKQYLADGMMDAILVHLSKISNLRVISRTSMEQYRKTNKSAKTIGKELGVAYLVEGSFQKEGDRIRLILQLIKTADDDHAWSNEYDRDWKDIFSVQSEVSEKIASELHAVITPEEKLLIRKIPTTNLTAYDYYLKGKNEINASQDSIAMKKARYHFQKALKLDSTFALAYTGLAEVFTQRNYLKTFLSEDFYDTVFILANKALSFDPQCSEAFGYRADRYNETGHISEALKEVEKAIKYDPNDWRAYNFRGNILLYELFDHVEGFKDRYEAILRNRGNELPFLLAKLGGDYVDIGFPELGKKYFQQALELDGDSARYLKCLAYSEYSEENFEKTYQKENSIFKWDITQIVNLSFNFMITNRYERACFLSFNRNGCLNKSIKIVSWSPKGMAFKFWQKGKIEEAKYYFDEQIKISEECIRLGRWNTVQRGAHFELAEVHAFLGDKEKAYFYLDEVNNNRAFPLWWVILFKYSPLLSPIRQEPRFQKILKDVEAKYQAEHERVRKWLVEQKML